MRKHYTYELRLRGATDNGGKAYRYIGLRSCQCQPARDDYWGSSKHLPPNVAGTHMKIILGRFDTRAEAVADEIRLHKKYDVAANPLFYNRANAKPNGFDTHGVAHTAATKDKIAMGVTGVKHTAAARANMSAASKGKPKSAAHSAAISAAKKGKKFTPEHCAAMSAARIGKPKSAATRKRMSIAQLNRQN